MCQEGRPVEERVGYQLKRVQAALRARMDATLRPLGLTSPQYACLELLAAAPGMSSSELARGAFVTRQAMNVLLRGLVERGWVERDGRSDRHGRALPVRLTEEGEGLLAKASGRVAELERAMVENLSDSQRRELLDLLEVCMEGLDGPKRT